MISKEKEDMKYLYLIDRIEGLENKIEELERDIHSRCVAKEQKNYKYETYDFEEYI